jgi:hypothetical protein
VVGEQGDADADREHDAADDVHRALDLGQQRASGRGNQAVIQPEQEQQHAADEVEMRMRGAQQEVLANAHHDAGDHADQQYQRTHAHHQRSDHLQSFAFLILTAGREVSPTAVQSCHWVSRSVTLDAEAWKRFKFTGGHPHRGYRPSDVVT